MQYYLALIEVDENKLGNITGPAFCIALGSLKKSLEPDLGSVSLYQVKSEKQYLRAKKEIVGGLQRVQP